MTDILAEGIPTGPTTIFSNRGRSPDEYPFSVNKPKIDGFPYNREKDEYSCPMGRPLPFKELYTDRNGSVLKRYWTAPKDCKVCPMKPQCVPNTKCKKISGTVYDEQYLRAYARQHSEMGKRMKKLRQSTVEPVFGSLTQFYGLRKIGVLGKAGAHKVMLMPAIAFNLKKCLKKGRGTLSIAFFKTIMDALKGFLTLFYVRFNQDRFSKRLGKNSLFESISCA